MISIVGGRDIERIVKKKKKIFFYFFIFLFFFWGGAKTLAWTWTCTMAGGRIIEGEGKEGSYEEDANSLRKGDHSVLGLTYIRHRVRTHNIHQHRMISATCKAQRRVVWLVGGP